MTAFEYKDEVVDVILRHDVIPRLLDLLTPPAHFPPPVPCDCTLENLEDRVMYLFRLLFTLKEDDDDQDQKEQEEGIILRAARTLVAHDGIPRLTSLLSRGDVSLGLKVMNILWSLSSFGKEFLQLVVSARLFPLLRKVYEDKNPFTLLNFTSAKIFLHLPSEELIEILSFLLSLIQRSDTAIKTEGNSRKPIISQLRNFLLSPDPQFSQLTRAFLCTHDLIPTIFHTMVTDIKDGTETTIVHSCHDILLLLMSKPTPSSPDIFSLYFSLTIPTLISPPCHLQHTKLFFSFVSQLIIRNPDLELTINSRIIILLLSKPLASDEDSLRCVLDIINFCCKVAPLRSRVPLAPHKVSLLEYLLAQGTVSSLLSSLPPSSLSPTSSNEKLDNVSEFIVSSLLLVMASESGRFTQRILQELDTAPPLRALMVSRWEEYQHNAKNSFSKR